VRGYRDWAAGAPDEVSTVVSLRLAPPLPIIPRRLHGVPVVTIVCCYIGADAAAGAWTVCHWRSSWRQRGSEA
jgi:hypothetical protein